MKFVSSLLCAVALLVLSACDNTDISDMAENILPVEEVSKEGGQESGDYIIPSFPDETVHANLSLSKGVEKVAIHVNKFALDVFKSLIATNDNNVCIAPFSVFSTLSMAANGDTGMTRDEIVAQLGNNQLTLSELNTFCSEMSTQLSTLDGSVWCKIANGIWVDGEESRVNATFNSTLNDKYNVNLFACDFNNTDVREKINLWIERNTYGFLKDFIELPVNGPAALVNTIYFRGLWKDSFSERRTDLQPFHNLYGAKTNVMTMHVKTSMAMEETNGVTTVIIPFGENKFAMTVMMPKEDFDVFCKTLSPDKIKSVITSSQKNDIDLSLPKFDCYYKENILDKLNSMGITGINEPGFNSMMDSPVTFNSMIHGAHIKIDESGCEAAGATALANVISPGPGYEIEYKEIKIDCPFVYMITETSTGAILFIGQVTAL